MVGGGGKDEVGVGISFSFLQANKDQQINPNTKTVFLIGNVIVFKKMIYHYIIPMVSL